MAGDVTGMIDETADEIRDMQTHSSSTVAVKAADALREVTDREFPTVDEYHRALEQNSRALLRANASHASLHNTQREIVERVTDADVDSVTEAQELTREVVADVIERVELGQERAAANAAELLDDASTLLTHDYSTTVLSAIEQAVDQGGEFTVYVTESRPRFLGRRTARHLAAYDEIDVRLVVDSAAGHSLSAVDRVVVGMTCIVEQTLYNRIGTYPLAATATDAGVPVSTIGSAAKIIETGFQFENEHRVASEVMREPAVGFTVENPAYDATPVHLLDNIVTDSGVLDSDELAESNVQV